MAARGCAVRDTAERDMILGDLEEERPRRGGAWYIARRSRLPRTLGAPSPCNNPRFVPETCS